LSQVTTLVKTFVFLQDWHANVSLEVPLGPTIGVRLLWIEGLVVHLDAIHGQSYFIVILGFGQSVTQILQIFRQLNSFEQLSVF